MPASLSGYVVKPIFPVATPSVDVAASQYPNCPFASLTSITPVIGQGFAVGAETRTGTEVDVGSVELEVGTMLARACMAAAVGNEVKHHQPTKDSEHTGTSSDRLVGR